MQNLLRKSEEAILNALLRLEWQDGSLPSDFQQLLSLTLLTSSGYNGSLGNALQNVRSNFSSVIESDTNDIDLFNPSYRYGYLCAQKQIFKKEFLESVSALCRDVITVYIPAESIVEVDGKLVCEIQTLPKDRNPIEQYLAGFSLGFMEGNGISIAFKENAKQKQELNILNTTSMKKESILTWIEENPNNLLYVSTENNLPAVVSVKELDDIIRKLELIGVYDSRRIKSIIDAKKKRVMNIRSDESAKRIVVSEWDLLLNETIPMAKEIRRITVDSEKSVQIQRIKEELPKLENLLFDLSSASEIPYTLLCGVFDEFTKKINEGEVDWNYFRSGIREVLVKFLDLSNGSKDTVLTKLNETEAKSFEDIENIISEGILEDKEINTGYLGVAEKISSIKLAIDIFVREIETSKKFPIELLRLVNYIVAEISCYYDSEKLTESEIVEIFRSSLSTYIQWNAEDRQSSMEVQLSRIVPPIVRAFACESSKSENPSVKKITEYFRNRNELVGVEMPGIETFEQNLVQSIEQNRPVKIMVKVCPSRRPKRLLDPETVPEFYETNPYMSDVAKLMLVTQEIIWKTKNSGFEVELEYVIMATDERDYLPPLKPYLGYSKGEGRMSTIQDRLDILSRNIVTFASICLPGVKVSIGQIEEYEEIDYRNGDYLEQYSRDLMQVAKEILVSDDPIIKKTLDENEKKYIERFSNGLYKQFADETIDYRLIAALRIATYSGQAKRLIRNGDIVLDTAEEPSTGRLRTFGIDPKSKIDPLSFAYASYGDREGFSKKLYKYKER